MAYELHIYPPNRGAPTVTSQAVAAAFQAVGLPCVEQPDNFGHWLTLEGFESALDLTIKNGLVIGASFRHIGSDDPQIFSKIISVFKQLGFYVSDSEGNL